MEQKKAPKEDINLMEIILLFISGIKKLFVTIFNYLGKLLQLTYRHRRMAIIFVILGMLGSFYFSQKSKRVYKVEAMMKLYGVDASTIMKVGERLSSSSSAFQNTKLENKLQVSSDIVKRVKKIEFFPVIDFKKDSIPDVVDFKRKHSLADTVNVIMDDYVYARLKIKKDVEGTEQIINSVVSYFNRQEAIQKSYLSYKLNLEERVKLCDAELKRLDSLANKSYFEKRQNQIKYEYNQLLVGNHDIQLFYKDQLRLQKEKAKTNDILFKATAPVVLPTGIIVNPQATNGRMKMAMLGALLGYLLTMLLSIFIENKKKWLEFLNKK